MDPLVEALKAEQATQHRRKPEYIVGASTDDRLRFVAVDRVSTNEQPGGIECARTLTGRRYMVTFPKELTRWMVATLGAYLTDEEWEAASGEREDEIDRRAA